MILRAHGNMTKQYGRFMQVTPAGDIVLAFDVIGTYFPARHAIGNSNIFDILGQDNVSNKLYIDYGDGTGEHEINFKSNGQYRRIYFRAFSVTTNPDEISQTGVFNAPVHFFQDLPAGVVNTVDDYYPVHHTIKLRFQKPEAVVNISSNRVRFYNQLPSTIAKLVNLETLSIQGAYYISSFPQDFYNSRIKTLTLANIGDIMNAGFPNWVLNSPLTSLNLTDSINLAGTAEQKKFNQINRLKETLKVLNLNSAGINYPMPAELTELYKLEELYLDNNPNMLFGEDLSGLISLRLLEISRAGMPFSEIERIVQSIPSLRTLLYRNTQTNVDRDFANTNHTLESLTIGGATWNNGAIPSFVNKLLALKTLSLYQISSNLSNAITSYGNFSNCTELTTLTIARQSSIPATIPVWFSGFTKLKNIVAGGCFITQSRVNDFVNNLYAFVTAYAPMTGTTISPFRSMTIDIYGTATTETTVSIRPSGNFQQPAGYVQGSNNGAPATPMEKIWVLTNQYGHIWTIKPL